MNPAPDRQPTALSAKGACEIAPDDSALAAVSVAIRASRAAGALAMMLDDLRSFPESVRPQGVERQPQDGKGFALLARAAGRAGSMSNSPPINSSRRDSDSTMSSDRADSAAKRERSRQIRRAGAPTSQAQERCEANPPIRSLYCASVGGSRYSVRAVTVLVAVLYCQVNPHVEALRSPVWRSG